MHADDRRIDHLHGGVMSAGQCAHDPGPYARSTPANEAGVAGSVGAEALRQIAPRRPRSQDPEDSIQDTTIVHSWNAARLVWRHRSNGRPLMISKFIAHDSKLQFGGLNHGTAAGLNVICIADIKNFRDLSRIGTPCG